MKRIAILFALTLNLHSLFAAVPLKWTVETSRVQPVAFDAVHGETLALQASFNTYGTPLQMASNAALFYQTNGMGSAWWTAPASVSSNVVRATFAADMDPGAPVVYGFLGTTGENYRAAFTLRFRKGPGAAPNVIDQPPKILDLKNTVVINPPWPTDATIDTRIRTVISDDNITAIVPTNAVASAVSNVVTKSYVEGLGISGGGGSSSIDTNAVDVIITNHVTSGYLCTVEAAQKQANAAEANAKAASRPSDWMPDVSDLDWSNGVSINGVDIGTGKAGGAGCIYSDGFGVFSGYVRMIWPMMLSSKTYGSISKFILDEDQKTLYDEISGTSITNGGAKAYADWKVAQIPVGMTKTEADKAYFPKTKGAAWSRYWGGDDFVVTITNYPTERGATRSPSGRMPQLYMSWKTEESGTNYQQVVWSETWWEDWLTDTYLPKNYLTMADTLAALDQKADRAWGFYDSHTGLLSPDGYTQISSSNIMIAAGMSYQQTVTTEGEVWVLTADAADIQIKPNTNGYFRISDAEGNSVFEIVKGDKRTVGAQAGSVKTLTGYAITHLQITYAIESDAHPTLQICNDFATQDWKDESDAECLATVDWTGESGAWVATVYGKTAQSKLFVKGSYEIGGDTYIKNSAPVSMEYIYLGGVKYKLGTAVISGNTVLTLTAQ